MWPLTNDACGNLSLGPRPHQFTNVIATVFITDYASDEQDCIIGELKRRGYTHVVMGPLVDSDGYHGTWQPNDWRGANFDRFLDAVQKFWDAGLAPIVFIHPDNWSFEQTRDELTPLLQQPRAQRLMRIVVRPAGSRREVRLVVVHLGGVRAVGPLDAAERAEPAAHGHRRRRAGRHRRALRRQRQAERRGLGAHRAVHSRLADAERGLRRCERPRRSEPSRENELRQLAGQLPLRGQLLVLQPVPQRVRRLADVQRVGQRADPDLRGRVQAAYWKFWGRSHRKPRA
jgi:hypothetical protein